MQQKMEKQNFPQIQENNIFQFIYEVPFMQWE